MKKAALNLIVYLFAGCAVNVAAQNKEPNILFIISDDHALQAINTYSGKYGITPNIDRIGKEGVVFRNAFVTNSICAPSRAVLLTGKYSHKNGHRDNRSRFDASQDVFSRRLQQGGYQTAWIGKWHLESYPQGFDYWKILPGQGFYYNPEFISMTGDTSSIDGYCTEVITDLTLDWLDKREKDKPFCLVVGEKATHRTWMPDLQDLGRFDNVDFKLPENFWDDYAGRKAAQKQFMTIESLHLSYDLKLQADTGMGKANYLRFDAGQKKIWDAYYDKIELEFSSKNVSGKDLTEWKFQRYMRDYLSTAVSMDRNIGRILDYLDQHGLKENTLVVYTSDQGFYMGEHRWFDKRFMYEESMRMPLLMRYPGKIKAGIEINDLVVNIDFAPTLLSVGGVQVPENIQGKSLLPLVEGKRTEWRESVYYHYYEYPDEHRVMPHFGIRTKRYKLIRFYGDGDFWELYDLSNDAREMNNLYPGRKYDKLVKALKDDLKSLIQQYDDQEALEKMMDGK
ncbi:MAG: sulfatase [Cyclobacteriaceae bacterium]